MIILKSKTDFNEKLIKEGFSKRAFAQKSGIPCSTLIQISNGKQSPRAGTAKKICDALGVNFDDLFKIVNSQTNKKELIAR